LGELAIVHVCNPFLPDGRREQCRHSPPLWEKVLHLLCQTAQPNPSIERTPSGMLRMPTVAAHV